MTNDLEIEVTEKMLIAARPFLGDEQTAPWNDDRDETLIKIYRAMAKQWQLQQVRQQIDERVKYLSQGLETFID